MKHSPAQAKAGAGAQARNETLMRQLNPKRGAETRWWRGIHAGQQQLEWHKLGVRKNYKSEKGAGQVRACTNRRGWTSLTGILKAVQDPRYPYASGPSSGPVDGAVPLNKRFDTTIRRKVDPQVFQRGNTCGLPARQVVKDY